MTSIATGIVTVSLLDQAPAGVTQTINRVVEKTVEKIVPITQPAAVITKEIQVPVVVKEGDLVIQAIEKNAKSLVRIQEIEPETKNLSFKTLGIVVSKDGLILAPRDFYQEGKKYSATFADAKLLTLEYVDTKEERDIVLFRATSSEKYTFTSAVFSNSDALKLGQTVVALGGDEARNSVGVGVISGIAEKSLPQDGSVEQVQKKFRSVIETTLPLKDKSSGFYLLDLSGAVIGLHVEKEEYPKSWYIPSNIVKESMVIATSTPVSKPL